jgi:rubrerythrin
MAHWKCMVCNIKMHLPSRSSHLFGKRHAAAVEAYQQVILQEERGAKNAGQKWICTICNIKIEFHSRESHLLGKRHVTAIQSQAHILERNDVANSSSKATRMIPAAFGAGEVPEDVMHAASKFTDAYGTPIFLVWPCMICGYYVPLYLKEAHLSSVDHIRSLIETIKSTCMTISQLQLQGSVSDHMKIEKMDYQVSMVIMLLTSGLICIPRLRSLEVTQ